jgi:uncharacterized protein (TIGR02453 family)
VHEWAYLEYIDSRPLERQLRERFRFEMKRPGRTQRRFSRLAVMAFDGFPAEAFAFYQQLEADNSREFWRAHRADYERYVLEPMRALAAELEPEFGPLAVYRPQRDTRFSADKSPYKTYQGAFAQRVPGLGFYVQVAAAGLQASGGFHSHSADQVARYRRAVDADVSGTMLADVVTALAGDGFAICGDRLKTMPRGVPAGHPRADLMRYRSLTAGRDWPVGHLVHGRRAFGVIQQTWRGLVPLCDWLSEHVGGVIDKPAPGSGTAPRSARRGP